MIMAYRVTAGYVTVQTNVGPGRAYIDIPRGAELPDDVPAAETEWLLRSGQIEEIGEPSAEPAPEPEHGGHDDTESSDDLDGLDKDALTALAKKEGVTVDGRWGPDKIAAAIREHRQK